MPTSALQNAYSGQKSDTISNQVNSTNNQSVLHGNGYYSDYYTHRHSASQGQQRYIQASATLGPTQNNEDSYRETYNSYEPNSLNREDENSTRENETIALQRLQLEQNMELKHLRQKLVAQPYEPVYNTRIRHGFAADYESEKYMKKLAEVCLPFV